MWSIHTIKYFAVLRQEIPTLYNINLEDIMLNERSRKRDGIFDYNACRVMNRET